MIFVVALPLTLCVPITIISPSIFWRWIWVAILQDGLLKYVNPCMAEITGYTVEEGIDTLLANHVDPDEVLEAGEDKKRRIVGE